MIYLLDLKKFKKNLKPVKASEYFIRPGEYHPEGLFSEIIFGPEESADRKKVFSYIELNCSVIHPSAYIIFRRLNRKIENYISAVSKFSLSDTGELQDDPEGVTGMEEFIKHYPKIKFRGEDETRDKLIWKIHESYKDGSLFIDIIPVIPPEYRKCFESHDGRLTCDPLNDYYVNIIRKASQAKQFSKGTEIYDIYNYEMQKAVIEHDSYIRKLIQKKHGLIRSQLLSKRSDFSGRAVIVSSPKLKVNEVGIPIRMGVDLFEPFIMYHIFNSGKVDLEKLGKEVENFTNLKLSSDSIKMILRGIKVGDKIPKDLFDQIFEIVSEVASKRVVILKRDPVLHAEGVRGFNVKIIDSNTIHLSDYHTGGFNADFDGDTMAVYHPITNEAQQQVREKMMRGESGDNVNAVTFELSKDMCAGLFIATANFSRNNSPVLVKDEDLLTATDPYLNVIYRGRKTTMGRAIFNSAFPPSFDFIDRQIKKKDVNSLIPVILAKYGQQQAIETFSKLGQIGFKFSTISAPSLTLSQFDLPEEVLKIKAQLAKVGPDEGDLLIKKAHDILVDKLKSKNHGIYDLVESGATKGWTQPDQMFIAKGIVSDPKGTVMDPIPNSFSEGLTPTQYFNSASGARKGIIDRTINTSETGYLSRQFAYILNSIEISRTLDDCKTKRTLDLKFNDKLPKKFSGRYVIDKRGNVVSFRPSDYNIGDVVRFRTPILCEAKHICHKCYGDLLKRHRTPFAGIIAAQVLGEAGTQTIMRTFHTGGAVKLIRQNVIEDTIQNDPYASSEIVNKVLVQRDNMLYAKTKLTLSLDLEDYQMSDDVIVSESEDSIFAKSLIANIESEFGNFSLILDYKVIIKYLQDIQFINKQIYKINYEPEDKILEVPLEADIIKEQLRYAQRLMGGKVAYKDVNHLYLKMFKIYGDLRDMDSVHIEILLSQVLRHKPNTSLPARLGKPWNPTMMNIKKIVFKTSFIQGLAFENVNEAITTGLITSEPEEMSILEKIFTGTLVVDDKKRKR